MMEIDPAQQPWQALYKILIGSVVPRPIGWISTVSAAGVPNLAPFSFFNVACGNPPQVLFCPMVRSSDGMLKDTLSNVRQTGEFVVNVATQALAQAVNLSSAEFPPEVDEFEVVGLTHIDSVIVQPPRVKESPIHLECRLTHIVELGSQPGGGAIVVGQVVYIHIRDELLIPPDKIDLARLQPIGRLAGAAYCRVTDTFEMPRPSLPIPGKASH